MSNTMNQANVTVARIMAEAKQMNEDAAQLSTLYDTILPAHSPLEERQFRIWLRRYPIEVIAESLTRTAEKVDNDEEMFTTACINASVKGKELPETWTKETICRYATGVMKVKSKNHGR